MYIFKKHVNCGCGHTAVVSALLKFMVTARCLIILIIVALTVFCECLFTMYMQWTLAILCVFLSTRATAPPTRDWWGPPAPWGRRAGVRSSSTTMQSPSTHSSRHTSTHSRSSWSTKGRSGLLSLSVSLSLWVFTFRSDSFRVPVWLALVDIEENTAMLKIRSTINYFILY